MAVIVKGEFMKLKRYFIVWIGVSLMLLNVLLTLFTSLAEDGMKWDFQFLCEQVIKNFVTMIFPMCITLITGYIISREYTDDTLKNIITIPVSFQKILAGKLIISGILSVFLGAVCFAFTVVANFIMGYGGFSISAAFTGLLQMSLLGLLLYLTMLPIIVLTSRKKSSFLAGVIIAFVYGFVGMFANGALQSIYPVSATLGLIRYRNGVEGVTWNTGLCLISVLAMCIIGVMEYGRMFNDIKTLDLCGEIREAACKRILGANYDSGRSYLYGYQIPGFMTGLSGMGYSLLRDINKELPCILSLEI